VVFVYWAAALPVCVVGVRSKNIRIHTFMAIIICVLQLIALFEVFPKLGF
jgi:lipopolysaccharide export LptBFGC system permease protein LptF